MPGSQESIPATALVSLFLANVFRQVEEGLQRRFPEVSLTLFWNVSCPIDHLDRKDLRSSWERMTGAAIELRHQISNPVPADILALATKLASSLIPPPKEERNYFVCPETLAAVKSFLESHKAESKTYAIVDVGAGTTEVSFFFNGRAMTEPGQPFRPSCLADSTQAIGGVNMDLELAELWKCSVLEARRQKERARHPIPSLKTFQEIRSQYWRTCGEIAKHKKLISPDDKRFDLFLIGGGGRLTSLRKALEVRTLPGNFVLETIRPLDVPEKLQDRSRFESDYDLLAIACGLASSLDWQYYQRDEVEPMHLPLKYSPSFEEQ
ncbi:MAG: hypothetical protein NZV14_14515 [Bryobacteraceae bacterium]|nr:hypothetical protein [Bryobacteraceae bacterium]MDW8379376.1 hypothetical protein [Bryobacterales bacterium]